MVRFPHSAVISWISPATYDELTASHTPGSNQTLTLECRAIAQGEGSLIKTEDGTEVRAKYKVIARPANVKAPFGANVQLTFTDSSVYTGTLQRMENFQVFSEIWL